MKAEQVADIFQPGMLIRRIGKGRKVMNSGWRYPLGHGANEFRLGPSPDAIDRIRRDIRSVERSERRRYCKSAAESGAVGLAGNGMTGGTSASVERCQSVGQVWSVGRRGDR